MFSSAPSPAEIWPVPDNSPSCARGWLCDHLSFSLGISVVGAQPSCLCSLSSALPSSQSRLSLCHPSSPANGWSLLSPLSALRAISRLSCHRPRVGGSCWGLQLSAPVKCCLGSHCLPREALTTRQVTTGQLFDKIATNFRNTNNRKCNEWENCDTIAS